MKKKSLPVAPTDLLCIDPSFAKSCYKSPKKVKNEERFTNLRVILLRSGHANLLCIVPILEKPSDCSCIVPFWEKTFDCALRERLQLCIVPSFGKTIRLRFVGKASTFSAKKRQKLLKIAQKKLKMRNASRICVSSLRRGHANLLCIVPILVYAQLEADT